MATPEEIQAELARLKEENQKLTDNLKVYQDDNKSFETINSKLAELESKSSKLEEENQSLKIQNVKQEAIREFPYAAQFQAHIRGTSPEEIKNQAKEFHEMISKQREEAAKEQEKKSMSAWGHIPGSTPPGMVTNTEDLDSRYNEAVKNKNWKEAFKIKNIRLFQSSQNAKA